MPPRWAEKADFVKLGVTIARKRHLCSFTAVFSLCEKTRSFIVYVDISLNGDDVQDLHTHARQPPNLRPCPPEVPSLTIVFRAIQTFHFELNEIWAAELLLSAMLFSPGIGSNLFYSLLLQWQ